MTIYMKIKDAERIFPRYDDYPSISKSGSLIGMKRIYEWDTSKCVQIGNYYYLLTEHPNANEYFGVNKI